jgi:hypothetical protein
MTYQAHYKKEHVGLDMAHVFRPQKLKMNKEKKIVS